jgi:hypothetical protein
MTKEEEKEEESEEEKALENHVWEPAGSLKDTLASLKYFGDDGAILKAKKGEMMESYSNFDEWLGGEINKIVSEEKAKADKRAWGEL